MHYICGRKQRYRHLLTQDVLSEIKRSFDVSLRLTSFCVGVYNFTASVSLRRTIATAADLQLSSFERSRRFYTRRN